MSCFRTGRGKQRKTPRRRTKDPSGLDFSLGMVSVGSGRWGWGVGNC